MACHGPVGHGNPGSAYPALIAQHSVYTVAQLQQYAAGTRYVDATGTRFRSTHGAMMETIAQRLTAEDIRDLASYIQGMR
jgi:cytochrome c553